MNQFAIRRYIIASIFIIVCLALITRLFYIQLIDTSYKYSADSNSRRYVTQYPARGIIYDRNGEILVSNEAAYDLWIDPVQVVPFDTVDFCTVLSITKEQLVNAILKAPERHKIKPFLILKQLSSETYAKFQEKMFKFPGFFVQPRTLRKYPRPIAAHLFGYVGEVDSGIINNDSYYKTGDYIGISGLEKSYEGYLRGKKGVSIFLVDVHNRMKGSFQNGKFDTVAVVGSNITCTIDARIQEYGEKLMKKLRGSIVAIEPSTGEVLCLVSSPSYDPYLLIGRNRKLNFSALQNDSTKPLFNRALMARYPPGSTFKLINGLIGLQEGVLTPETRYSCARGYHYGNRVLGCHSHASPLNLRQAIQNSCNAYFCNVFRTILDNPKYNSIYESYSAWRRYVISFGYGVKLDSDFPNELAGYVPTTKYYDKYFGKNGWKTHTIISLAIGQAELGATPLQLANMVATVANRGYYYTPHIIKKIEGVKDMDKRFSQRHYTPIDSSYYDIIGDGMEMAVTSGTARGAYLEGIRICGKTGTAQNPHGKDHSVFFAFAPRDNPKIAIAVYVENAGFGATWAVPIASLIMEKYLTNKLTRPWVEEHILQGFTYKK
jgi:penicillin-binding protein 2